LETDKVTYTKVHYTLADADLVFVLSEGKRNTSSFGFYELFRVADGKLVERWDSRRSVPSGTTQSGLPIF